jgi:hypothetical protein
MKNDKLCQRGLCKNLAVENGYCNKHQDKAKKPKPKVTVFDHDKVLPGAPSVYQVFGLAWAKAYGHLEPQEKLRFLFNGYQVTIKQVWRKESKKQ